MGRNKSVCRERNLDMSRCQRGEIWLIDFNPGRGSEQQGMRPGLVIQNDTGNRHAATTIVAAVTTKIRPFPVTVVIEPAESKLKETSMVNLAQLLTLDQSRLVKKIGRLNSLKMLEVDQAIQISLGLRL